MMYWMFFGWCCFQALDDVIDVYAALIDDDAEDGGQSLVTGHRGLLPWLVLGAVHAKRAASHEWSQ